MDQPRERTGLVDLAIVQAHPRDRNDLVAIARMQTGRFGIEHDVAQLPQRLAFDLVAMEGPFGDPDTMELGPGRQVPMIVAPRHQLAIHGAP